MDYVDADVDAAVDVDVLMLAADSQILAASARIRISLSPLELIR